jgi:hypothetical protein
VETGCRRGQGSPRAVAPTGKKEGRTATRNSTSPSSSPKPVDMIQTALSRFFEGRGPVSNGPGKRPSTSPEVLRDSRPVPQIRPAPFPHLPNSIIHKSPNISKHGLLISFLGAALLTLMIRQSSSQFASVREKQHAESRDRFNFFDLELLKVTFITSNAGDTLSTYDISSIADISIMYGYDVQCMFYSSAFNYLSYAVHRRH